MNAVEFTANLSSEPVLKVPREAAARLPKSGTARVIVLTSTDDESWHLMSASQLNRAYGVTEPEYGVSDLKP